MNKYADLSNRTKSPNTHSILPAISEGRLKSPKVSCLRLKITTHGLRVNTNTRIHDQEGHNFSQDLLKETTSGISKLAYTQNMLISTFSGKVLPDDSPVKFPHLNLKNVTDEDFTSLLEKLDEVISPRVTQTETLIHEGITSEFSITVEGMQVYKIPSKGKKCPLSIKIRVVQGKIQSLVTLIEPRSVTLDRFRSAKSNFHEIYDAAGEFRNDFLYICVRGSMSSTFKIMTEFGKHKFLSDCKKYEQVFSDDFNDSFDYPQNLKKKPEKNFIKENLKTSKAGFLNKGDLWEIKKTLAAKRRKKMDIDKKKKAADLLSKRIKKLEEEALGQERVIKRSKIMNFCKEWLVVLYKLKSVLSIKEMISMRRHDFLSKVKTSAKVYLIQKYYKMHLKPKTSPKAVAYYNLLLYRHIMIGLADKNIQKNLYTFIGNSARTYQLSQVFSGFCQKTALLQKAYRRYLKKKNFRMATLRILWNRCLDRSLLSKKAASPRRRDAVKFIPFPNSIRDQILSEFYYERWDNFLKEIRSYGKALLETNRNPFIRMPEFKYIPSDVIMEGMIRSGFAKMKD